MHERSYRWDKPYRAVVSRRPQPILPVSFVYTRATTAFDGLVDSGAERSVCSARIARLAGLDPEQFPIVRVEGVGATIRARRCPIDLLILGRRIGTEILVVETNTVVLGRHDVFAAFQFGFDERAGLLLIEPY